jgi:hypothetical protein
MTYCGHCATQLSDGVRFCGACGTLAPAGAQMEQGLRPVVVKPATSFIVKLLLTVYGIGLVLALAGIGSLFYMFRRAVPHDGQAARMLSDAALLLAPASPAAVAGQSDTAALQRVLADDGQYARAVSEARALLAATPAPGSSPGRSAAMAKRHVSEGDGQCAVFTMDELNQVLNTKFTHVTPDANGCTYKGDAPRLWVRSEARWKGGKDLVKERSDAYAGLRQSMINQHYTKAEIDSHAFPITPYPGVGDEAFVNLWNAVIARKGDAGITIDLRYYRDSDELTRMVVNTALSRLAGDHSDTAATPDQPVK